MLRETGWNSYLYWIHLQTEITTVNVSFYRTLNFKCMRGVSRSTIWNAYNYAIIYVYVTSCGLFITCIFFVPYRICAKIFRIWLSRFVTNIHIRAKTPLKISIIIINILFCCWSKNTCILTICNDVIQTLGHMLQIRGHKGPECLIF